MKAFTALVAVALSVSGALAQTLTVNTPASVVVCQPLLITWVGGTPPYFLNVVPANQPGALPLQDFGRIEEGNSQRWAAVNVRAGTSLSINLRDSTGALSQSAPFTVAPGTDEECLNSSSSSSSSTSTRPTTSGSSTSTTTTTTSTSTTTTTTSTTPTTTTTTTTSTTPTTSPTTTSTTPPPANTQEPADQDDAGNGAAGMKISVVGALGAAAAVLLL